MIIDQFYQAINYEFFYQWILSHQKDYIKDQVHFTIQEDSPTNKTIIFKKINPKVELQYGLIKSLKKRLHILKLKICFSIFIIQFLIFLKLVISFINFIKLS